MINKMQIAIIKKDLRALLFNKRLFVPLMIIPLIFTVFVPILFIVAVKFAPASLNDFQQILDIIPVDLKSLDTSSFLLELMLNNLLPTFFLLIPIMTATIMAASSFVGEKEKRTLETLLYCPLTLKQIFLSKILASFVLSILVSFSSFLIMLIVTETGTLLTTGALLLPSVNWLITMLLLSPSLSLLSITLIVRSSAKAQTVEEAQQRTAFLILPIILLVAGQATGLFWISSWILLGLSIVLAIIAWLLVKGSIRKFTYESILKT